MTSNTIRLRATYAVLVCGVLTFSTMQPLVVRILAEISDRYDSDQATSTWVVTAYLLSASICTPLLGRIGDGIGKRRTLAFAIGALAVGSLISGLTSSIGGLIAARVVQGAGGGILPLSFGIARDEFPSTRVPSTVAMLASMGAIGFAIGVAVGGPMVDLLGFHSIFFVPAAIGLVIVVATTLFVPDSPTRLSGRLPILSAVLLAGWLTALLLPISQGASWGWTSLRTLGLVALSVLLLCGWIVSELRATAPIIDMTMMRIRAIWSANVLSIVVGFAMFSSLALVPQLLQARSESSYGLGTSVTMSGLALIPAGLATFVTGILSVPANRGLGPHRVVGGAMLVWAAAMAFMAWHRDSVLALSIGMGVMGAGLGLLPATLAAAVVDAAPVAQTGAAGGMHANLRTIGGAAGTAVTAAIVTAHPEPGFSASGSGCSTAFLVLGALLLAGSPLIALLPTRSRTATTLPTPA
ncbi:MAG: MFS transporter [Nocardioidaceae bacterium]